MLVCLAGVTAERV